ncbi:MAG: GntR family transcriptional regulator [Actinomycetota bacterium]
MLVRNARRRKSAPFTIKWKLVMEPLGKRHRSLRESVAEAIRNGILAGSLQPGDRLVEDDLASRLGVSRMPVREALATLETEGFVDLVPRRGASVAMISAEEAVELFEVRSMLEGLAARLAARRRVQVHLDTLKEIISEGRKAVRAGDRAAMPRLHQMFHVALAEASGNGYLYELAANLPAKIEWLFATEVRERAPISWPEHARILELISGGDEERAEQVTRQHVDDSAREFLKMIDRPKQSRRKSLAK